VGWAASLNPPRYPFLHGINDGTNNTVVDVNIWQRLIVANSIDQNGFPHNPLQGYLGAQWLWVQSFNQRLSAASTSPMTCASNLPGARRTNSVNLTGWMLWTLM